MRSFLLVLVLVMPMMTVAKVHYAKVEPYERATIKSSVAGIVLKASSEYEGSVLGQESFVQIDDVLDKENLKNTKESLRLFEENLQTNNEILEGLASTLKRRKEYYDNLNMLETASKTQKDNAFVAYIAAKNQYLGTKEKIITLRKQIIDLKYKYSMLQDTIAKKNISFPGKYLYRLMVHSGEFVAPGVPLAIVDDISRAKLEIYLDSSELAHIQNKQIYINGKKTDLKIAKLWKVADDQYISSYRAQILLAPKYQFSTLLKIEFR